MVRDLRELPKLRDSISFLYFEHAVISQQDTSIVVINNDGKIPVPISSITCMLLGPGTSITHAAVKTIVENGCQLVWCGEKASRFYAYGLGKTRSSANLMLQAKLFADSVSHMAVVRRMYAIRFPKVSTEGLSLDQIRGMEGVRVRQTYQIEAKRCGVNWTTRKYRQIDWDESDDINRALSLANTVLYGVCHAAIVALGFSPGLGFIHTGKMLSFVYDVADMYKTTITIPAAFEAVKDQNGNLDYLVRLYTRRRI